MTPKQRDMRCITALIISPDGQYAISASADSMLKVWQLQSGQVVATLSGYPSKVHTIAITCDGKQLISAGEDEKVYSWDFTPNKKSDYRHAFSAHQGAIHALALTSDGTRIISAGRDHTQQPALSRPLAKR